MNLLQSYREILNVTDDYKILIRIGRGASTGLYETNRNGRKKSIMKYVVTYETPIGSFTPEIWKKKTMEKIKTENKLELWGKIKQYCKKNCAWLGTESSLEEHAIDCLCNRAYKYWEDFKESEDV